MEENILLLVLVVIQQQSASCYLSVPLNRVFLELIPGPFSNVYRPAEPAKGRGVRPLKPTIEQEPTASVGVFEYVGIIQYLTDLLPNRVEVANRRSLKPLVRPGAERDAVLSAHLKNGGTLEIAARIANHPTTRTTQLYDRETEALMSWRGSGCEQLTQTTLRSSAVRPYLVIFRKGMSSSDRGTNPASPLAACMYVTDAKVARVAELNDDLSCGEIPPLNSICLWFVGPDRLMHHARFRLAVRNEGVRAVNRRLKSTPELGEAGACAKKRRHGDSGEQDFLHDTTPHEIRARDRTQPWLRRPLGSAPPVETTSDGACLETPCKPS